VTTQYIVTATLGVCSQNDTVVVNVNAAPVPDAGSPGLICYGQSYTLQGTGGIQYSWSPATYLSSATVANPVSTPAQTITYSLSVIDANGCSSLVTDEVTIDVTPPIKVYTFPYDTVAHPGDTFSLLATSIAPQYLWTPSTGLSSDTIANPVLVVGNIGEDRVYKVTAYNAAGCKGEGYVRVRVYKGPELYIPTAFTPNNDGRNDRFVPFPVGVKQLKYFRVYNRWGQLIYSTNELHRGWDGTFGGKEQPSGVYVWMAEGITLDNKTITHTGTVVLIR
jgi:gliding motility-associated-like protein